MSWCVPLSYTPKLLCGTLCFLDLSDSFFFHTWGFFSACIGLDPQDHSFQGRSDGACLEASAGLLEGRPGTCPRRAELGLGPLLCTVTSRACREMAKGSGRFLDILSAGEWGCVPSQLLVWHGMSQHWHLLLLGGAKSWGQWAKMPGAVFTS